MLTFKVNALPVAQPRQRHRAFIRRGKACAMNYTPAKSPVNVFKESCREAVRAVYNGEPLDVPMIVDVVFVMRRPSGRAWKNKPTNRIPYAVKKNDRDNLMKSFQDALNGLLWVDDGLIWDGRTTKVYAALGEEPCVEFYVSW